MSFIFFSTALFPRPRYARFCYLRVAAPLLIVGLSASLGRSAAPIDFSRDIQPILAEHCFHCHGADEQSRQGNLRLDVRDHALKGGESGEAAIVVGQPAASAIIARITSRDPHEVMPPRKEQKPVKSADLEKLRSWIAAGAPYAQHWAFTPPRQAELPHIQIPPGGNAIDVFVAARLESHGLRLATEASPASLCRRLHLDLIGLPPSPQILDAFVRDCQTIGRTTATRKLIDELLESAQYGERWARVWLDAARYADSNGYEKDLPREQWAWRDWVIDALNRDMPYDQFIIEQVAGDLLPNAAVSQKIATGFLRNGMINEEGAIVPEQFRMDGMFDRLDTIGKSVLGLSLQCAQCHTHKFDPITQNEYYGIFAFLNNVYDTQSWVYTNAQQNKIDEIRAGILASEARLKKQHPDWAEQIASWEASLQKALGKTQWQLLEPTDLDSSSGLNHPTTLPDKSILVLGHRTISGDVLIFAEPKLEGATGIRLEALTHGDLPFEGPGRSYKGTWALTEMIVETQSRGSDKWEKLKLQNATADFSEPSHAMEPEWVNVSRDKDNKRTCGPVSYLIDGKDDTAWKADRGAGRRNSESVAAAQFEKPTDFPAGKKLRISLRQNHGGDDNGPKNSMLGRFRLALTTSIDPQVANVSYAAALALQTPIEQRTAKQHADIFTAWREGNAELKSFNDEIETLWKQYPEAETSILHLAERSAADRRETFRLDRGQWDRPKEVIPPHIPAALHPMKNAGAANRLTFAQWLADKNSPLTARVQVNRVWQTIFGVGLVETSEDFGTRAEVPEQRELLDWLAVDFMDHGWSQKHLIRTIVRSAAYGQNSSVTPKLLEIDPNNRLLSRGARFRVDAEVLRDMALSLSGLLHPHVGGPSIFPPVPPSVLEYNYVKPTYWIPATGAERYRRSLYVFRKRSMPDPVLTTFDAPNADTACARRPRSNTPLAALVSLNETIFVEAAQAMSLRILREGGKTDADRADYAFRLCTSRLPQPAERDEILAHVRLQRQRIADGWLSVREIATGDASKLPKLPPGTTPQDAATWTIAARVLLNLDETVCK